jgi:hypothetical protein
MIIILLFTTPKNTKNPIPWLIRKFENSTFSHVAIQVGDMVYESSIFGVRDQMSWRFGEKNKVVTKVFLEVEAEQYTVIMHFLNYFKGVGFGVGTIVGMAMERLFGVKNYFKDRDRTFLCSEYAIRALQSAGMVRYLRPEKDGPLKLWEALIKLKEFSGQA